MTAAIDEIAAMRSCWHPNRNCTGLDDCACVPKPAAIATARAIATEMPVPLRIFPSGEGGVMFECFDDPASITFRGFECFIVEAMPDGTIFACDMTDDERTWPT